jgi:dipeptidyl aminopeptidase/acylaminoacyl peptidase
VLAFLLGFVPSALAAVPYQQPPKEILDVLEAPEIPAVQTSPDGDWLLLQTPVRYPPIADRAAPMYPLAGVRVDPRTNGFHTPSVTVSPTLVRVADGRQIPLNLPAGVRILDAEWSADEARVAIVGTTADRVGLWLATTKGPAEGQVREVDGLALDPLLGSAVSWMADQRHLVVKRIPVGRGAVPAAPTAPFGPIVRTSGGDSASSTYEARDLLTSAYDEQLFDYFATSQVALVDVDTGAVTPVGDPDVYSTVSPSPDGRYLLVERLRRPWSYRVGWWRFAHDVEVWSPDGAKVATVASLPTADQVPIHGVEIGPRDVQWRQNAPATLIWTEALDHGDPEVKVPKRDQLMQLPAPFSKKPSVVMLATHRVQGLAFGVRGLVIVEQEEWERRWRHVWTVNADQGPSSAHPWFDLSENDAYASPGSPVSHQTDDGAWLVEQDGDWVYFTGVGSSPGGDRPFLDRRSLKTARSERLFRSGPEVYEQFLAFGDSKRKTFLLRRQSPTEVPNVHLATIGAKVPSAPSGEALYARADRPITSFADPTPQLRGITKKIVTYQRKDGVPLSFTLYLPQDYQPGTRLPTVVWAYPREYSDPATAGQVSGSERYFDRFTGPSDLFFVLEGYAVLHNATMPVVGDPKTAYDTFVEQLTDDAQAAIDQAVAMGVTDPDRVGVMGHSHGGLMTATLLAHTDLFRAGIARSGAYNHTIRPFGFQNEMRTLWEAEDTYLHLSPVMFAPQFNEPVLLIHGAMDENPGTVPLQSERLFEAIRGTGGTAKLVMLPFEGHAYLAKESFEDVLFEQIDWFDRYVKNATPRGSAPVGVTP